MQERLSHETLHVVDNLWSGARRRVPSARRAAPSTDPRKPVRRDGHAPTAERVERDELVDIVRDATSFRNGVEADPGSLRASATSIAGEWLASPLRRSYPQPSPSAEGRPDPRVTTSARS